jgi:hypothetical protein
VAALRSLEDSTVQYEGGGIAPSAEADLAIWLQANECADMPVAASHGDVCTTHTECLAGTQVMECHPHGEHNLFYAPHAEPVTLTLAAPGTNGGSFCSERHRAATQWG